MRVPPCLVLAAACTSRSFSEGDDEGSSTTVSAEASGDAAPESEGGESGFAEDPCVDIPAGTACVPEGAFLLGCGAEQDCLPPPLSDRPAPLWEREVFISAFAIDTYEVTELEYARCVAADACARWQDFDHCTAGKEWTDDDLPVDCVTWFDARDYCEFVGKRLPTEAEWEKAARGPDARVHPWGIAPATCDLAVMWDEPYGVDDWGCWRGSTWPPGSKPLGVSPYGAHDMAGNAEEWVSDWLADGLSPTSPSDPQGASEGSQKLIKGGRDIDTAEDLLSYKRRAQEPDGYASARGFRCAISLPSP